MEIATSTLSNREPEAFDPEEMLSAIDRLEESRAIVDKIRIRNTESLVKKLNLQTGEEVKADSISSFYGLEIQERDYMPDGVAVLLGRDGHELAIIKF